MTSLHSLFSIDLLISDVDHGHYGEHRLHTILHPEEPRAYTASKILAAAHCMSHQPEFGAGWHDRREPDIATKEVTGDYLLWAHVGAVARKNFKAIRRLQHIPHVRFYFYDPEQIEAFCHAMRGSKENWIEHYGFFEFEPDCIEALAEVPLERRTKWEVNIVEGALYLTVDGDSYESSITSVDMWSRYQHSLTEPEVEEVRSTP